MSDADTVADGPRPGALPRRIAQLRSAAARMRPGNVRRALRRTNLRALLLYASMPALSGVNAVVGLLLPALLGPADFGHYAIAVTLFQYGLILDCGTSQLLDRRLPAMVAAGTEAELRGFAGQVLWTRLYIAAAALMGGGLLLYGLDAAGRLPFALWPGLLSLVAGLGFMVALGPMAVWRATTQRAAFARWSAACAIILAVGRPVGMVWGGLLGCFALLAAGYGALAVRLQAAMPLRGVPRPGLRPTAALLASAAPLFATSFVWAFYMTANRWIVSFVADPVALGQFAFGANIVYLIVGTVGALAQLHYPAIVSRAASCMPFAVSGRLARDLCWLAVLVTVPTAVGIVAGPRLIDIFYHTFAGAETPVRRLLVAVPALVIASWLLPLSLSTAARPWIEGVVIYPAALAILGAATLVGYRTGGIDGAAWGLLASAVPLVVMQLASLRLIRLLTLADAALILAVTLAATACLGALCLFG